MQLLSPPRKPTTRFRQMLKALEERSRLPTNLCIDFGGNLAGASGMTANTSPRQQWPTLAFKSLSRWFGSMSLKLYLGASPRRRAARSLALEPLETRTLLDGITFDSLSSALTTINGKLKSDWSAAHELYELGLAHVRLAQVDRELGDHAAAEESATRAVALLHAVAQARPDVPEYRRDLANGYVGLGLVRFDRAHWAQAEAAYRQALAIQEERAAAFPEKAEYAYALAMTYRASGFLQHRVARTAAAAARYQRAIDVLSALAPGSSTPETLLLLATTKVNLATVYAAKGWFDKTKAALPQTARRAERESNQ
jgi:tetratricopeptide (TPR) repeat protein